TLVTSQQTVSLAGVSSPEVVFSFGFITGETPGPGTFLDSFTVSFQSPALSTVAVLVTVDGSGPLWLPSTTGGLVLGDSQIQRQIITPPADAPVFGGGTAYQVGVLLPVALLGPTLNVTFDLFDNQNGINSLGWYQGLQVVSVPEPRTGVLVGLVLIIVALKKCVGR
ncbi:MAG: hypothetical protein ACREIC_26750, partial [Limisphaerales bacterium]